MSTVEQIEKAITQLNPGEIEQVTKWIHERFPVSDKNAWPDRIRVAKGIWKDHEDLPDIHQMRKESDRF